MVKISKALMLVLAGSIYGVMLFVASICSAASYPQSTATPLATDLSMNQYKLKEVGDIITKGPLTDVRAFGAVGDGVADDTTAIQNAINYVENKGSGTIIFPSGTYKITNTLVVNASGTKDVHLLGMHRATINNTNTSGAHAIQVGDASIPGTSGYVYTVIEDLIINGNTSSGDGVRLINVRLVRLEDLTIAFHGGNGIYMTNGWVNNIFRVRVQSNRGHGIQLYNECHNVGIFSSQVTGHNQSGKAGLAIRFADTVKVVNCDFEGNDIGLLVHDYAVQALSIDDNQFEGNITNGIVIKNKNDAGTQNIIHAAISINNNLFYPGQHVKIGTDTTSGEIRGGQFLSNFVANSNVTVIAGDKVFNFFIDNNELSGTSVINYGPQFLGSDPKKSNPVTAIMPRYPTNPTLPWGTGDTKGYQGDIRYDDNYIYIKTSAGWKRVILSTF